MSDTPEICGASGPPHRALRGSDPPRCAVHGGRQIPNPPAETQSAEEIFRDIPVDPMESHDSKVAWIPGDKTISRWHRRHRWSTWSQPFAVGGLVSLFGGGSMLKQQRSCSHCKLVQQRTV